MGKEGKLRRLLLVVPGVLLIWMAERLAERSPSPAAELWRALRHLRPVEPRLSGLDAYAKCAANSPVEDLVPDMSCSPLPAPGSRRSAELTAAVRALHRAPEGSLQALWAGGLWQLVFGRVADAVDDLRRATAAAPADGALRADLAAAYLVRAQREDRPFDLVLALSEAETAVELAPELPAAWFNRALARHRLGALAGQGWRDYLVVDPASSWSEEARRFLAEVEAPSIPQRWLAERGRILELAGEGRVEVVAEAIAPFHQQVLSEAMSEVLGAWAEAFEAGRRERARQRLETARTLGAALASRGGDQSLAAAVDVLDRASPELLPALAAGQRLYRDGYRRWAARESAAETQPLLEAAARALRAAGSPVELWAEGWLAEMDDPARGVPRLEALLRRTDFERYPALAGNVYWTLGLIKIRDLSLGEARESYSRAVAAFARAAESENLATMHDQLADALAFLGHRSEAWRQRFLARKLLMRYPASKRLHTLLWSEARLVALAGHQKTALILQDEGLRTAEATGEALFIAEAHHRRSRIYVRLDRLEEARRDIETAWQYNRQIPDRDRERSAVSIRLAEATYQAASNPLAESRALAEVRDYFFEQKRALNLWLEVLPVRARALERLGDLEAAQAELEAALELAENRLGDLRGLERLAFLGAAHEVFLETARFYLERRQDDRQALVTLERARAFATGFDPKPLHAAGLEAALGRLPSDRALVVYALFAGRLACWVLHDGRIRYLERFADATEVERDVDALIDALQRGRTEVADEPLSRLTELLVAPFREVLPPGVDLVFVPDPLLARVPFAALRDPASGRHLIEEGAVAVAPAANWYLGLAAEEDSAALPGRVLLVGDPAFDSSRFRGLGRLLGARAEIAAIAELYPGAQVLMDEDATPAAVLQSLASAETFHLAGHAQDGRLLLAASAGGGELSIEELAAEAQGRAPRLVVLSACSTAVAQATREGALASLTAPFLAAGSRAVVGTLWDVGDEAARELLVSFHQQRSHGVEILQALRAAQLRLLRHEEANLRSPTGWAAFQLVGD